MSFRTWASWASTGILEVWNNEGTNNKSLYEDNRETTRENQAPPGFKKSQSISSATRSGSARVNIAVIRQGSTAVEYVQH